jgi:cytochrome bd-type quinol oxidase subunit 1
LAVLLFGGVFLPFSAFAQDDASGAIASAQQQIVTCYDSAKQAEAAGANISSLTSVLDEAGNMLSQAELAYSQGDFGTAQNLASQCSQNLNGFVSEANGLRDAAIQRATVDFWVNVVGSTVGTFVVMIAGFAVWWFLKKRYPDVEVQIDEPSGV